VERIAVIGGGAWGTALALVARSAGGDVTLWAREPEVVADVNGIRENRTFLPGARLDPGIRATCHAEEAIDGAGVVLLAVPAQYVRAVTRGLAPHLAAGTPVVICAKGVEGKTGRLMSEVLAETLPACVPAVLSGPTFAAEVAAGSPTAVTLACADEHVGEALVRALGTRNFRPYLSDDLAGAQIGGAVKNVLAIACGIVTGRGLGENARAALITRGLAETARLGRAKGAQTQTLMGLSGLGDLVLTCTSRRSRNMSLGVRLAEGTSLQECLSGQRSVVEGVFSSGPVLGLAASLGVTMPICAAVNDVLWNGFPIDEAIAGLLSRRFTAEWADA
jgi:glycerol-3-phosphate dehydrogenase (NAD(P)+)